MKLRLITIGPSHYCDKVRLALELAKLPYEEDAHLPIMHLPYVKRAGGAHSTPTLVTAQGVFDDSTDILEFIQRHEPAQWRPYPRQDPELDTQTKTLEDRFDERLGPHTRRVAYFHLLPLRKLSMQVMSQVNKPLELTLLKLTYPLATALMAKSMNINAKSAARSLDYVRAIFDEVDALLADGRPYLVGDRLTAADLTFASLAAPLLEIPQYHVALPQAHERPAALNDIISELSQRPAGRWAAALYAQLRPERT